MNKTDYYSILTIHKKDYILLKLLMGDGFVMKEFIEQYSISERTAIRMLQSVKDAIYDVFGDDAQIIYDRKRKRYTLIFYKSIFNFNNLPLF